MRILLISSAFSGLTQRFYTELDDAGYEVSVELHQGDVPRLIKGVSKCKPDLILCPFLTKKLPKQIFEKYTCLIVHPGIKGDRGPSSLDWAIQSGEKEWGVTMIQAAEEMDAGDIWASQNFLLRNSTKSSVFNREVTQAAVDCLWETLSCFDAPAFKPQPLDYQQPDIKGQLRPAMKQKDRQIDWKKHSTKEIIRRIHAADGSPGVLDEIYGRSVYLHNAHKAKNMSGPAGSIIATSNGAICRATEDGAVWIGHLKQRGNNTVKLPAVEVLKYLLPCKIEKIEIDYTQPGRQLPSQEVWYLQEGDVAYVYSSFHNGGMSTEQCKLFLKVYRIVAKLPVKAIVLMGGEDNWSNGIHLNHIENAEDPAQESWLNINAIDDLIYQIITTMDKVTIAALSGNAGAGGAMMALAVDRIFAREGVVLNPHYKNMGELYGSEYWTYLLPKRVGHEAATMLTEQCLPISVKKASLLGFVDQVLDKHVDIFTSQVKHLAKLAIADPGRLQDQLADKAQQRKSDEVIKPLAAYRKEELTRMYGNFYGDTAYHAARRKFVYKLKNNSTPANIAKHRRVVSRLGKWFGKPADNAA